MGFEEPVRETKAASIGLASVLGAAAGLSLTAGFGVVAMLAGAAIGGVTLAVTDSLARARQRPGQIPALWSRIVMSVALIAPVGWAIGKVTGAGPIVVGMVVGTLVGALGLRPQKVILGPLVGFAVGLGGEAMVGAERG